MFMLNCRRVLLLALLAPTVSWALGLGDIHLKSALNAPLDAEIDIVGASPEELTDLKANLASRDTFRHYGLEYPTFLGTVTFEPAKGADGQTVLHVHSSDAVNEPFATLLVEVNWARGHLVREYTVLLDPPVFTSQGTTESQVAAPSSSGAAAGHAPAATSTPAETPSAAAGAATATPPPPAASAAENPPAEAAPGHAGAVPESRYLVKRGDTLSSIAAATYGTANRGERARQLVSIFRANPSAFAANMNVLRAGARLKLPGDAELDPISPGEASTEVRHQYADWKSSASHAVAREAPPTPAAGAGEGPGQLRLVPPQEAASAPAAGSAGGAQASKSAPATKSAAATAGVGNGAAATAPAPKSATPTPPPASAPPASQASDAQRLLALRNAPLASLQANSAASANQPATPPAVAPAPAPAAPPAANTATAPVVAPVAVPAAAPKPVASPATTHAAAKPKSPASESGNSMLDLIAEFWYVPALLVVVLIVLVVVRFVRAKQEDAFDRSLGRLSEGGFEATGTSTLRSDTVPVRPLAPSRDQQSYQVQESGTHVQPTLEQLPEIDAGAVTGQHVAIDEGVAGEAPVALDQGDPLAEADFHMAYGLYDQAAELVSIAMSREPTRRDLRLKLLEIYFVWGNKDRFLQTARELAKTRDQALPGEWEKIVIMGRQIAPDDALFTNTGALGAAAAGGVDLNLEGGQNRIDFDLLGEPSVSPDGADVDLDLGAALGDTDRTGEAPKLNDTGVDFVLDDPQRGNDATGSTRELPSNTSATTATVQLAQSAHDDAPTVEQPRPRGGELPTLRQKIDAATRSGITPEQTAELALDDLGLDLGEIEEMDEEEAIGTGADGPTMLAALDEEDRQKLGEAEEEQQQADETLRTSVAPKADAKAPPAGAKPTATGTWLFSDNDFAQVVPKRTDTANMRQGAAPTEIMTKIQHAPTQVMTQLNRAPEIDTGASQRLAALDVSGLDLDLGDLKDIEIEEGGGGIDLDVGTPSAGGGDGTFVRTQKLSADELALPELEPATMSEVGTKLDLARAYMDMGDPEGARSILSEVLSEGSVSQKQEARRLIDTLPG
jgi:pilus assembly protein FimV